MTIKLKVRLFGVLSLKVPAYDHKQGLIIELPDGAAPVDILKQLQLPLTHIGLISHANQAIPSDASLTDGMTINFYSPVYGG